MVKMVKMVKTGAILLKKTRRDIAKNLLQFAAIILIAALAVCLFTGFTANYKALQKRVQTLYDAGRIADLWVTVSDFDPDEAGRLEALPGVERAEPRLLLSGLHDNAAVSGLGAAADASISAYAEIIAGTPGFMLEKSMAAQILIKQRGAESAMTEITDFTPILGQTFEFTLPFTPDMKAQFGEAAPLLRAILRPEGKNVLAGDSFSLPFTVTGVMTHPECVDNGAFAVSYFYTRHAYIVETALAVLEENYALDKQLLPLVTARPYMTETLEKLTAPNQYVIRTAGGARTETVSADIRAYFSKKGEANNFLSCFDVRNLSTNAGIMSDITQSQKMTLVFPVIFFLVALLVILTTISQIIIREKTQIGMMKALGVSTGSILFHYLSLTVSLVTIGFVIGVVTGPILVPNVMNQKYKMLFSLPRLAPVFPVPEILGILGVFAAAAALVAYLCCRKEIARLPADSMRPIGPAPQKRLPSDRRDAAAASARPRADGKTPPRRASEVDIKRETRRMPLKMALRNLRAKKSRGVMVVAGIMGCMALLLCGFGIDDTLDYGVRLDSQELYKSDVSITFMPDTAIDAAEIAASVPGIARIETYAALSVSAVSDKSGCQTTLRIVEDDSAFCSIRVRKGRIALAVKTANDLNAGAGDRIAFTVNGERLEAEVDHVFDAFYLHGLVANASDYPALFEKGANAWAEAASGADTAAVGDALNARADVVLAVTSAVFRQSVNDALSGISLMTFTLKIFAILLAVVVLYNIALLNQRERQRDIATLKVLGFSRREIALTLMIEVMILTLLGGILGLGLGYPLTVLVLSINQTPVVQFLYRLFGLSYLYASLITLGTGFVINLVMSLGTGRIKMTESLKSFE
jgi:ABC-type antimicrobial peptide transport system permease subunit